MLAINIHAVYLLLRNFCSRYSSDSINIFPLRCTFRYVICLLIMNWDIRNVRRHFFYFEELLPILKKMISYNFSRNLIGWFDFLIAPESSKKISQNGILRFSQTLLFVVVLLFEPSMLCACRQVLYNSCLHYKPFDFHPHGRFYLNVIPSYNNYCIIIFLSHRRSTISII